MLSLLLYETETGWGGRGERERVDLSFRGGTLKIFVTEPLSKKLCPLEIGPFWRQRSTSSRSKSHHTISTSITIENAAQASNPIDAMPSLMRVSDPMPMNHDDSNKENSSRGNAMTMEAIDGGEASNSNCLVAAADNDQLSKNSPTPQELKLWREIADWIDRKEHGEL